MKRPATITADRAAHRLGAGRESSASLREGGAVPDRPFGFFRPLGQLLAAIDCSRRCVGQIMDAAGLGPEQTPCRISWRGPGLTLKGYSNGRRSVRPSLLLVPAPIKRAYIWDLLPEISVVQRCLGHGLAVYLLQWERPDGRAQDRGLADYADRLIAGCLSRIQAEQGGRPVFLAGHSLGGTLAAVFASLHPQRVAGLVLLGAPVHFGPEVGAFGPMVSLAPPAQRITAGLGNVPGAFLDWASWSASPKTFAWEPWQDRLRSLSDRRALRTHGLVRRWTLDEMALPRRLYEELIEGLYRGDGFMQGTLRVGDAVAAARGVRAPILSVIDPLCDVVPPAAMLPLHRVAGSTGSQVLWYQREAGVALHHVGPLVGREAHRLLWPGILRWIDANCPATT